MSAIEPVSIRDLPYVIEPKDDWPLIREILRRFEYDPVTGIVRYRVATKRAKVGDIAGYKLMVKNTTYLQFQILNRVFRLHRVIWVLMRGEWPDGDIDHINRNGLDNRWCNLRDVPPYVNQRNRSLYSNNSSGIAGVYWHKKDNKWHVSVSNRYVGLAETLEQAKEMRLKAELEAGDYITDLTPADAMPPHLVESKSFELVGWKDIASHVLG